MLSALQLYIGRRLSHFLTKQVGCGPSCTTNSVAALARTIRPGDVLLVDGTARISTAIKYLTQSTWSHAALYTGPIAGRETQTGEPHVLVEANLGTGVTSAPLSLYADAHTRICRPVRLQPDDCATVIAHAVASIGLDYDMRNVIDLARFLLPPLGLPPRWRRRVLYLGSGSPSRVICSTLIAQAFERVRYPILPSIAASTAGHTSMPQREVLHIRHHSLYTPRDFDISPYFATVKPTIEQGFDYRDLIWADPEMALSS
jgi:hypothetical protein